MAPGHSPRTTTSSDSDTSAHADTNAAPRRSSGTSRSCANSSAVLPVSSPCTPDHRADSTPGMQLSAATSNPESSATVGSPVAANPSRALTNALSSKVAPVSGASSNGGTSSSETNVRPVSAAASNTRRNSANFLRLRLATSSSIMSAALPRKRVGAPPAAQRRGGVPPPHRCALHRRRRSASERLLWSRSFRQHTRIRQSQRLPLRHKKLFAGPLRGVEQLVQRRPRERRTLAGPLNLDQGPGVGGDDVHVDF